MVFPKTVWLVIAAALLISSTATNCMDPAYIKALMAADHSAP